MVMRFGGEELINMYYEMRQNLLDPNNRDGELLHALATVSKSHISTQAQKDSEEIRQALGGIGYSKYSEMSNFIDDYDINQTWEGDNKVLLQ